MKIDKSWIRITEDDRVYKFVKSKLPQYDGKREVSIIDIYKCDNYYIAYLNGGENGSGDWKDYLEWIWKFFSNFDDVWLLDLINDAPDDVWTLRFGFRIK